MNFNVYVPKDIGLKLSEATKALHCSRNSIVTEALSEWLQVHLPSEWPQGFFDFSPVEGVPDFKALRKDLADIVNEDPLA
ncbi:MAG: hypothetical protein LLF94_08360 [Chlamydiales bacterium]|nr:hypothetical protein [Chlamydiales bacterium]